MTGASITGGLLVGTLGVPKIVDAIAPSLDDKTVNIATIAVGAFGAMNTKGEIQTGLLAMAGGAAAKLLLNLSGMGYVVNPNTNLENIVGYGNFSDSRWNAGEM